MATGIQFDPLRDMCKIPRFEKDVQEINTKYNLPRIVPINNTNPELTGNFYSEVLTLCEKIKAWLKTEFPEEIRDETLFHVMTTQGGYGCTTQKIYGLEEWISARTKPADHGGYPGAQWGYDTSERGRCDKLVPAIWEAYTKCKTLKDKKQKKKEAEEALEAARRKAKEEYKLTHRDELIQKWVRCFEEKAYDVKYNEETQRYTLLIKDIDKKDLIDEMKWDCCEDLAEDVIKEVDNYFNEQKDLWVKALIDSISMHYFPERIDKGVRRPAEWKPDFNLNTLGRMYRQNGSFIGTKIEKEAWIKGKDKRDLVLLFHEQEKNKT